MKRIRPINDYVIIKKTEQEMRKVGSIFIPETRNELTRKSDVVAMNAGRNDVKVGDKLTIQFGQRSLTVEVLQVAEAVRKDDAVAMYREIPSA